MTSQPFAHPRVKLTDQGLVDAVNMKLTNLIETL